MLTLSEPLLTLFRLARRSLDVEPAKNGLSNTYTIAGQTARGYEFLFGRPSSEELARATVELERILGRGFDGFRNAIFRRGVAAENAAGTDNTALTALSLGDPRDFSISWTNYANVYEDPQPRLNTFAETLRSLDTAQLA